MALATGCRGILGFEEPVALTDAPIDGSTLVAVGFDQPASLVDEVSGTVQIEVVLSAASDTVVDVRYAVGLGTAIAGEDFQVRGDTLIFQPGETRQSISLAVLSDDLAEADEAIELTLTPRTGATLVGGTHTVTIAAAVQPRATVSLTGVALVISEATTGTITATLDQPAEINLSVTVAYTGTATPNADYMRVDTITFAPGMVSVDLPITSLQDTLDENLETVTLTLTNPDPALQLGTTVTLTHMLDDNDPTPTVSFVSAGQNKFENQGAVGVVVTLSAVSGRIVTVPFTLGGSATATADFALATSSPLAFPAGILTKSITVNLVDDAIVEANELLELTLGPSNNATLAAPAKHNLTILDND